MLVAVFVLLALISCSTTSLKSSPYDVGSNLAQAFLSTDVLNSFHSRSGRNPVVVIGLVSSSSANADDSQISSGFKNKLVASGKVDLIIGSSERDSLREERIEQLNWGNMDAAKSLANEMVADYFGRIFITPYGRGYIISADIVEVETGKVVWSDQYNQVISLPEKSSSATTAQTQATLPQTTSSTTDNTAKNPTESKPSEITPATYTPATTIIEKETEPVDLDNKQDDYGYYIIDYLPNDVTLKCTETGNMFFQFKLENTEMNYAESGYGIGSWPTYRNEYNINLSDPIWARYVGKKVVFFQGFKAYCRNSGSVSTQNISVQPSTRGGALGVYDLEGIDSFTLTSSISTGFVDAEDLRFETFVLMANEINEGEAFKITDMPTAIVLKDDFSSEKAYVITIKNVPMTPYSNGMFGDMVTLILDGRELYADEYNGEYVNRKAYVMSITRHGAKYDAEIYVTGLKDDILLTYNNPHFDYTFNDYGTVSFAETPDTNWVEDNCIDLSSEPGGEFTLTNEKNWGIIWELPKDDKNSYKVTIEGDAYVWGHRWNGYGDRTGSDKEFIISQYENTSGYISLYTDGNPRTITWKIEKIN